MKFLDLKDNPIEPTECQDHAVMIHDRVVCFTEGEEIAKAVVTRSITHGDGTADDYEVRRIKDPPAPPAESESAVPAAPETKPEGVQAEAAKTE